MKVVKLPKQNLEGLVRELKKIGPVYAPVRNKGKNPSFREISSADEIELKYTRTILPIKRFFLPPTEPMFRFSSSEGYKPIVEGLDTPFVLFGVHSCDIHALKVLDIAFSRGYVDEAYMARRRNGLIVGVDCVPDEYCFCHSMGTDFVKEGFDLFLSDIGDSFLIRVGTSIGDDVILAVEDLLKEISDEDRQKLKTLMLQRAEMFKKEQDITLGMPEIMSLEYESKVWDEIADRCFSCGICTIVCPTCYCYNVTDKLELNAQSGVRERRWDSCLYREFSLIAGGFNFAAERSSRVKKRYYHKLIFTEEFNKPSCVGCGRCSEMCPAGIKFEDVLKLKQTEN